MIKNHYSLIFLVVLITFMTACQTKSVMVSTKSGAKQVIIKETNQEINTPSIFDQALANTKAEVNAEIYQGIEVPTPKNMARDYTRETHNRNFFMLQLAGDIYSLT